MIVKYCISGEICVAEVVDVSFDDGILKFTPAHFECFSFIIEKLSVFEAKYILDDLYNFLKVDVSKYKDKTKNGVSRKKKLIVDVNSVTINNPLFNYIV